MTKKIIGMLAGAGVLTAGAGAGVAAGIVIPKTLKLKDGLEKFVMASGGPSNSLKGKEEITYVALGDSIAAGYNGFLGADHLSYADFTAQSFINHGRTVNYHNFAQSGDLIKHLQMKTLQDPAVTNVLKGADLVTISIGGNDLLRYLEFFGTQFGELQDSLSFGVDYQTRLTPNDYYVYGDETTNPGARDQIFGVESVVKKNSEVLEEQVIRAKDEIIATLSGERNNAEMFNMNETYRTKILQLVKQGYMEMLHTVHLIAKNAKIVVVTPPNPFLPFGDEILNTFHRDFGMTINEYYQEIINTMKNATLYAYDGERINYTDFMQSDSYKNFNDAVKNNWENWADYRANGYQFNNAMPNIADIHPSTFGHEIIGENLFRKLAAENGLTIDPTQIQKSVAFTDDDVTQPWERIDEGVHLFNDISEATTWMLMNGGIPAGIDPSEFLMKLLLPSQGALFLKSLGTIGLAPALVNAKLDENDGALRTQVIETIRTEKGDDSYVPTANEIALEATNSAHGIYDPNTSFLTQVVDRLDTYLDTEKESLTEIERIEKLLVILKDIIGFAANRNFSLENPSHY